MSVQRVRIVAEGETVTELEIVNGTEDDIQPSQSTRKYIDNGILYIRCNGKTYNAQGQRVD